MKIIRASEMEFVPTSHDDPKNPGSTKKVLVKRGDVSDKGWLQMLNWSKIMPGRGFDLHYHESMEEVFVVITGTGHIKVDEQEADVGPGDTVIIPAGAKHEMHNTGTMPLEYIAIGIPDREGGKTITVT